MEHLSKIYSVFGSGLKIIGKLFLGYREYATIYTFPWAGFDCCARKSLLI